MRVVGVVVPISLLLDPGLTASAKVIWMAAQLGHEGTRALSEASGLAKPTVRRCLVPLAAAGGRPPGPTVFIPRALLADPKLGVQAKVLYGVLRQIRYARFTFPRLSTLTHASPNTTRHAVQALVNAGWLHITQAHRLAPVRFALSHPGEAELASAKRFYKEAKHKGEALMRLYLSLLVASAQHEDDAGPGILENPLTGKPLEFDRFYPPDAAFEFQGPQHFGPTEVYSKEKSDRQRAHDLMKLGMAVSHGVRLSYVLPPDLSLEGMRHKIGNLLPVRDLTGHELLISWLEGKSQAYRRKAGV